MNSSFFTCDRTTHLKIAAVSLVAAFVVAAVAIHARVGDRVNSVTSAKTNGMVVKAGRPAVYSTRDDSAVR
jgi:hypothetical protein